MESIFDSRELSSGQPVPKWYREVRQTGFGIRSNSVEWSRVRKSVVKIRSHPAEEDRRLPYLDQTHRWYYLRTFSSLLVTISLVSLLEASPGQLIYRQKCATCHGMDGQGVEGRYDEPLLGEETVSSLTRIIERTMPEENPEDCVGREAQVVAEYVHSEFYSRAARERKGLTRAARVDLTRLTVSQYRNAIADLLMHFTPVQDEAAPASEHGLAGEYYQSRGMSKAHKRKLSRIDPRIQFDFGEESPSEEITAEQFAIVWQGSLFVRDTGHYEFRLSTPNGARLYLNTEFEEQRRRLRDDSSVAGKSAMIDAWVSSGDERSHTARLFLLGGRQYPIRLEFFKYKETRSSISLEWKPPHDVWRVIDQNNLTSTLTPRSYVVETVFSADDRSEGYERGNSISPEWHQATSHASIAAGTEVIHRLPILSGVKEGDSDRDDRLLAFVKRFARVAFRRPLTIEESRIFNHLFALKPSNAELAVRRSVLFTLNSPNFLYPDLFPEHKSAHQHRIASRLSFALWDSIPDATLLNAADQGKLHTRDQLQGQATRMLADPRAKAKLNHFFEHWLELEERDLEKDKELFPDFNETVIRDLRHSLSKFLEEVVWSDSSDYRELLQADYLLLNDQLRILYHPETKKELVSVEETTQADDFERVTFPSGRRAGVLTHPYLLSALAYHNNTSPIHRGVFLTRNIVGRSLKPPPDAVAFKDDEFDSDLTMREKVTQLTKSAACMSCHSVINPLGFALENYDAVGRWRNLDNHKPVSTKSIYVTATGENLTVQNAADIANYAINNQNAQQAFVTQIFRHLLKHEPAAFSPETVTILSLAFAKEHFNIQKLMARIAVLSASQGLNLAPKETPSS